MTSLHESYESSGLLLEYKLSGLLMGVQSKVPGKLTNKEAMFDTTSPALLIARLEFVGPAKELHGGQWWEELGITLAEPNLETGEVRFMSAYDVEGNLAMRGFWERSEARRAAPMPTPPTSLTTKEYRERVAREKTDTSE